VLLCVSSAGSQLRIRDHQLCRCAQEVDGKTRDAIDFYCRTFEFMWGAKLSTI
jgi:hypothetical protein